VYEKKSHARELSFLRERKLPEDKPFYRHALHKPNVFFFSFIPFLLFSPTLASVLREAFLDLIMCYYPGSLFSSVLLFWTPSVLHSDVFHVKYANRWIIPVNPARECLFINRHRAISIIRDQISRYYVDINVASGDRRVRWLPLLSSLLIRSSIGVLPFPRKPRLHGAPVITIPISRHDPARKYEFNIAIVYSKYIYRSRQSAAFVHFARDICLARISPFSLPRRSQRSVNM